MAKPTKKHNPDQPAPTGFQNLMGGWKMPTKDEEFVFTSLADAPAWVDRNWASFDRGPALALPAGDLYGRAPYTTKIARIGDTVRFMAAQGAMPPRFEVLAGDHSTETGIGTVKPAQASNASLEDMLRTGHLAPDELGTDAAAQVAHRSPELQPLVDGDMPAPEPVEPAVRAQS